jgi:hypothetical protein
MPRVMLKDGLIYPLEPFPEDWKEGVEMDIERADPLSPEAQKSLTDEWMDRVEASAAQIDPEDDERFMLAIAKIRAQAKEMAGQELDKR